MCAHRCCQGQQKASDPLELELQAVVSHPVCMLATELRSSARVRLLATE